MPKHKPIDTHQRITDQVIASLEEAGKDWSKPWSALAGGMPVNASTEKGYRGINIFILALSGYDKPQFAGYGQWQQLGGQVRKGEKATTILKYSPFMVEKETKTGTVEEEIFYMRPLNVFNADQVEGVDFELETINPDQKIEAADTFFSQLGAKVGHGGNRAYYSVSTDHIQMPSFGSFSAADRYYATLAHEHIHWTGHSTRCARNVSIGKKTSSYAKEELVAEMGAIYTMAHLGLNATPHEESLKYLNGWLSSLQNDKTWIFKVQAEASKAAKWLQGEKDTES